MIYARTHDQTVAEDYFAAMQRVEERLEILPEPRQNSENEVVKVREPTKLFQLIQQLRTPQLRLEERLGITKKLCDALDIVQEYTSFVNASNAKDQELKGQLIQTQPAKTL